MLSARLALTFMLALSLPISGRAWAHGALPDNLDGSQFSGIESADSAAGNPPADSVAPAVEPAAPDDCDHHDVAPATPAVNDGGKAPPRAVPGNPHGCCTDGSCPCPPPNAKGMAIGPAHLATTRTPVQYAPVSSPVSIDPYNAVLRPPIH